MKRILLLSLLFIQSAFADTILTSNVPNGCSSGFNSDATLIATFTRNQYQCNTGYYLPANTDHCVLCPDVYDCDGGTFTFNEDIDQGNRFKVQITGNIANGCKEGFLRAYNNAANITATFTPNVHNCNPGYYLPANVDSCTICPAGNACPGGNLSFNETTPQGITACSGATPYAPAGSAVCYPKMMHLSNERPEDVIYLKSTETTTPAFHVNINGTVYHANMTTTPTYMTNASTHYFKVMVDNVEYYVCDDTTYVAE